MLPARYSFSFKQGVTVFIASIWFINGFFCKLLNFVPRHQAIVAKILGHEYANFLTRMIGLFEIMMAVWVLSGIWSRRCAMVQVILIATMNSLEFFLAPELLLFGKINAVLAALLISVIIMNEFLTNVYTNKTA